MIVKNNLKVRVVDVLQWILVLLLYQVHDSALYIMYGDMITAIIFFAVLVCAYKYPQIRRANILIFLVFLLADIIFVRFINDGGIGISIYFRWISQFLIAFCAVAVEPDCFIDRFVKYICFMAVISLVYYVATLVNVEMIREIAILKYEPWEGATHYGGILYTTTVGYTRNSGIFNEPGLYQIVLNSALYLLLFQSNKVHSSDKIRVRFLTILLITILTTQSTTAYLGMLCVLVCYILSRRKGILHRRIVFVGLVAIAFVIIDYSVRGNESLLYTVVLEKVDDINHNSRNDNIVASGQARMLTIVMSIQSILKNPFGIGIDRFNEMRSSLLYGDSAVAAVLFSSAAQIGVIPVLVIVVMYLRNTWKKVPGKLAWVAVAFLFFNTLLAQSDLFYPGLWILMFLGEGRGAANHEGSVALQSHIGESVKNSRKNVCC